MSRTMTLLAALLAMPLFAACDLNEGTGEEAREAFDDLKAGEPIEEVGREAGDMFERRTKAEKRLDEIEGWIADQREQIRDGTKKMDDGLERRIDDVERETKKIREDVNAWTREAGDDIEDAIDDLESTIDETF